MITFSRQAAETTPRPARSKSPINDSQADISERFANHIQQQILLLQAELKNKDILYQKLAPATTKTERYHLLFPKSK